MHSGKPKVLQQIGGRPMLHYVLECAQHVGFDKTHVVYGSCYPELQSKFPHDSIHWVEQSEPLGTGHALMQAMPHVDEDSIVCVLYGDNPFVQPDTIARLLEPANRGQLSLLTFFPDDPTGYGRILRDDRNRLVDVVEEKDATEEQRTIREVNAGNLTSPAKFLRRWLKQLKNNNAQKEYYLTDVIRMAVQDGVPVTTCHPSRVMEAVGANNRMEQAELERAFQLNNAKKLMEKGVEIVDPARFDLRGNCEAGKDCRIDVNVVLEGEVILHDNVEIGANCVIRDSQFKDNVKILPNCVIEDAVVEAGGVLGPFSRIRPGTKIGEDCKVGNFVEVNRSSLGNRTKANHLAYIGDADIGDEVNVGAGSITCNYDGKNKHKTRIGDRVFVGSNASLVAPIEVGDDAMVGAGSTVSEDIDQEQLVVERGRIVKTRASRVRPKFSQEQ